MVTPLKKFDRPYLFTQLYAVTISPPQRYMKPDMLYSSDLIGLVYYLNRASKHYIIYPEFQHTTSRLHYHCIVRVDDMIKWHRQVYQQLAKIGYMKVDRLNTHYDHLRWLLYIRKDWELTKSILNIDSPVIPNRKKKVVGVIKHKQITCDRKTIMDYL